MLEEESNEDSEEMLQMSVLCKSEEGGEQASCMCCTFNEKRGEGLEQEENVDEGEKHIINWIKKPKQRSREITLKAAIRFIEQ